MDSQKITLRDVNSPVSLLSNKKKFRNAIIAVFLWCLFIGNNRKSGSKPCRFVQVSQPDWIMEVAGDY